MFNFPIVPKISVPLKLTKRTQEYLYGRESVERLVRIIKNIPISALVKTSCNANTLFGDVVHLYNPRSKPPSEDKDESVKKCITVMRLLCERVSPDGDALSFLLTKSSLDGFTPLHDALKWDNPKITEAYFEEVRKAIGAKALSQAEHSKLLTASNVAGFTPLQDALRADNQKS